MSIVAKSQATAAWERKNWVQVTVGAVWGRVDAAVFEDPPDRGCSDTVTDAAEFARDSSVAPSGVVGGHLDDESADLAGC